MYRMEYCGFFDANNLKITQVEVHVLILKTIYWTILILSHRTVGS